MNVDKHVQSVFALSPAVHFFYFQNKVVRGESLFFWCSQRLVCKRDAKKVDGGPTDKLICPAHEGDNTAQER